MQTKLTLYSILLIFLFSSCIKPFYPDLEDLGEVLVVDGFIHSNEGPYTVRLNLSNGIYAGAYPPVEGATVSINDDQGNSMPLTEVEPGVYQTDPNFRGVPGHAYALSVMNARGNDYTSSFEVMPEATGIDSLYARLESRQSLSAIGELPGYQFYLDGRRSDSAENYYLFDLNRTYKYNSAFQAAFIYTGVLRRFPEPLKFFTCYKTDKIDDIFLYDTEGLEDKQVRAFPLNFEGTNSNALTQRYSLRVKMYTLSREAHRYWEQIKNLNDTRGDLFTQQPYQLNGNITSSNEEVQALGYFFAGGLSEKRIFVNRPANVPFYLYECFLITEDLGRLLERIDEFPTYLTETDGMPALASTGCIDCRELGGQLEKPDFWID